MDVVDQIREVRGLRVLLDFDLAALYGVTTKRLNEAVRRNPARFPPDFAFRLTPEEVANLRSQFATSRWGGTALRTASLYRAGCRHALWCSEQPHGGRRKCRDHAGVRHAATSSRRTRGTCTQDRRARGPLRRELQGRFRRDPRADGAAREKG